MVEISLMCNKINFVLHCHKKTKQELPLEALVEEDKKLHQRLIWYLNNKLRYSEGETPEVFLKEAEK